jgi:hypothetical protein
VLWAERALERRRRILEQGPRLSVAAEGVEDGGECGAVGRHVDVLGSECTRADLDGAPGGRLGRLGVAARVGQSA